MGHIPIVRESTNRGLYSSDLYSKLLNDRIIFLGGQIDDHMADIICAQLLYLSAEDPDGDISLYINSPGGSVSAGMAIYDTMNFVRPDVSTVCLGMAASMGALLLSSGTKGKRICLPNSTVMIHQPLGGVQPMTQASDMQITVEHLISLKESLNRILAENCDQPYDKVKADTDRDFYLTAKEAVEYGIVDRIITKEDDA